MKCKAKTALLLCHLPNFRTVWEREDNKMLLENQKLRGTDFRINPFFLQLRELIMELGCSYFYEQKFDCYRIFWIFWITLLNYRHKFWLIFTMVHDFRSIISACTLCAPSTQSVLRSHVSVYETHDDFLLFSLFSTASFCCFLSCWFNLERKRCLTK